MFPMTKFTQVDIQNASMINQNSPTWVLTSSLIFKRETSRGKRREGREANEGVSWANSRARTPRGDRVDDGMHSGRE